MERKGERENHVKERETRFKMIKYNGAGGGEAGHGQRPSGMEKDYWKLSSQRTVALRCR